MSFTTVILVALTGAMGSAIRYVITVATRNFDFAGLSMGTWIVNCGGCLLAGWLWTFLDKRMLIDPQVKTVLFVGFLGGLTTFSALILQTAQLYGQSKWLWGSLQLIASNAVGLLCIYVGAMLGSR